MKENGNKKNGILGILKGERMAIPIIVLIALGILLMTLTPTKKESVSSNQDQERLEKYAETLEDKIAALCSKVKGVSDVSVTLYFDSGFETVYAYNEENKTTSGGSNSEKKYVTIGSGNDESMVCIVEKMPNICGVAIVCRGGGNSLIASELINLISSAYGVPRNKVYVAEGKN